MSYISNDCSTIGDILFMACACFKYLTYICLNFLRLKSTGLIAGKSRMAWSEAGATCLKVGTSRSRISEVITIYQTEMIKGETEVTCSFMFYYNKSQR